MNGGRLHGGGLPALVPHGASRLSAVGLLLAGSVLAGSLAAAAAPPASQARPAGWGGTSLAGSTGNQQGFSVAVSGNVAVVGAPGVNNGSGVAKLWVHHGGQPWHSEVTLSDPRKAKDDGYAWSVAISSTKAATYVAIGGNEQNGKRDFIYIYEGSGKTWHREASIADPGSNSTDLYGEAMAISSNVLVVGAPGINGNMGTIYIYKRSGQQWNLQAAEVDPGDASNDLFGRSVSTTGDEVLAGAVGLAYVFTNESGNQWTQTAVLRNPGAANDNFGYAANLDAATAVIGAPGGVPGTLIGSPLGPGAAYVFTRKGSAWSTPKKLTAPAGTKGDEFGASVTEADGRLLIGMPVYGKVNCGTAFAFISNKGAWAFHGQVLDPSCTKGDEFGFSAALAGATGVIGAPDPNNGQGAVFFLSLAPTSPEAGLYDPKSPGVPAVAFSPDSSTLAAGDFGGSTFLWDVATRTIAATLRNPNGQAVFADAFSPDGSILAAGTENIKGNNGSLYLWKVSSHTRTATLVDPGTRGINAVAFSPDGKTVAAGDNNGSTYLWSVSPHTLRTTLRATTSLGDSGLAFSPNGRYLVVGDKNGNSYVWDVTTHKLKATLNDPKTQGVADVAFSSDGTTIATSDRNGHAYLWEPPGKVVATLSDPASQSLNGVAFSRNGTVLATATYNKTHSESGVDVWDVATRSLIATLHDPRSDGVYGLAFTPDGSTLAIGDANAFVYLWDMSWLGS